MCSSFNTICNLYLERNINCYASTRYVWKLNGNRNNSISSHSSNHKCSSCNLIYASNRNATTIFQLPVEQLCSYYCVKWEYCSTYPEQVQNHRCDWGRFFLHIFVQLGTVLYHFIICCYILFFIL